MFEGNDAENGEWEWKYISTNQEFKEVLPMTHWLFQERMGLKAGECKIEVRNYVSRSLKPPRSPNYSRVRLTYLFRTDEHTRKYYTLLGSQSPRIGLLLEDIDMLAAEIANKHTASEEDTHTVTRSATVQLVASLSYSHDLVVDAFVKRVGTSSIVVYVSLNQVNDDEVIFAGEMSFVLVLLNSDGRPHKACKLEVTNSQETQMVAQGEHIKSNRTSAKRFQPNNQEMRQLHDWCTTSYNRSCSVLMTTRKVPNTISPTDMFLNYQKLMHYQQRNADNVIYGGYIMKQGLEQAFLAVLTHLKPGKIILVYYSLSFDLPVAIGTILNLRSQIVYTERNYVVVVVNARAASVADVEEMDIEESQYPTISNKFLVIFEVEHEPPEIVPTTYAESLMLLDAKRRAKTIFRDMYLSTAFRDNKDFKISERKLASLRNYNLMFSCKN